MQNVDSHFTEDEVEGYFRWSEEHTDLLRRDSAWIHHACHAAQFDQFQKSGELFLRSNYGAKVTEKLSKRIGCVWCDLHPWHNSPPAFHNHFGAFTIKLPLSVLNGRRFYVMKRKLGKWTHLYFVQREKTEPLFRGHPASKIDPAKYFEKWSPGWCERNGYRYEFVLTEPASLKRAQFIATDHLRCIRPPCDKHDKDKANLHLRDVGISELMKIARQFPVLRERIEEMVELEGSEA